MADVLNMGTAAPRPNPLSSISSKMVKGMETGLSLGMKGRALKVEQQKIDLAQKQRDITNADTLDKRVSLLADEMETKNKGSFKLFADSEGGKKTLDSIKKYRPDRFDDAGNFIPLPPSAIAAEGLESMYAALLKKKQGGSTWTKTQELFGAIMESKGAQWAGQMFNDAIKDNPTFKALTQAKSPQASIFVVDMLAKLAKGGGANPNSEALASGQAQGNDPLGIR